MHRLFLDANVLISLAYREGSGLSRLFGLPQTVLLTSDYAVTEASRNLQRADQRARLGALLSRMVVISCDRDVLPSWIRLPAKDLPILQDAIAAGATHLLTGDKRHFGQYFGQQLEGVLVLLPRQYLASVGASG